jgi:hypothetical protein
MARNRRSFDDAFVERLRSVPVLDALNSLGLYWRIDPTFQPVKNANTKRLYVSVGSSVIEMLLVDRKWYDVRLGIGGGGCIDLAMHLLDLNFVQAVKALSKHSIEELHT